MSETNDIPAFRRAVAAAPDDDLPRLVFADWLNERNDDGFNVPCPCNETATPGRLVQQCGPPGGSLAVPCPTCNGGRRRIKEPNGYNSIASLIRTQTELRHRGACSVCGFNYMIHDIGKKAKGYRRAVTVDGVRVSARGEVDDSEVKFCQTCENLLMLEMNAAVGCFRQWLRPIGESFEASSLYVGRRPLPVKLESVRGSAVSFWGGFPEGVIATLEAFYGAEVECPRCGEGAEYPPSVDWDTGVIECEKCESTGLIFEPGFGRLVVTEYPVKAFADPDREARRLRGQGEGNGWAWDDEGEAAVGLTPSGLPYDIFSRLKPAPGFLWAHAAEEGPMRHKTYAKPSHATTAFSAAVLEAVRDQK